MVTEKFKKIMAEVGVNLDDMIGVVTCDSKEGLRRTHQWLRNKKLELECIQLAEVIQASRGMRKTLDDQTLSLDGIQLPWSEPIIRPCCPDKPTNPPKRR